MPLSPPIDALDRVYIAANLFVAYSGTPVMGTSDSNKRVPHMLFDATTDEFAIAVCPAIPTTWNTVNFYLWTLAANAVAANNIRASCNVGPRTAGSLTSTAHTGLFGGSATLAISGTQYTVQRHAIGAAGTHDKTVGGLWQAVLIRVGSDAADNYAGDIGFIGIELVKAS